MTAERVASAPIASARRREAGATEIVVCINIFSSVLVRLNEVRIEQAGSDRKKFTVTELLHLLRVPQAGFGVEGC